MFAGVRCNRDRFNSCIVSFSAKTRKLSHYPSISEEHRTIESLLFFYYLLIHDLRLIRRRIERGGFETGHASTAVRRVVQLAVFTQAF